jgi:hypothetical protein
MGRGGCRLPNPYIEKILSHQSPDRRFVDEPVGTPSKHRCVLCPRPTSSSSLNPRTTRTHIALNLIYFRLKNTSWLGRVPPLVVTKRRLSVQAKKKSGVRPFVFAPALMSM